MKLHVRQEAYDYAMQHVPYARFDEESGDFLTGDRLATHEEIATFYLHLDMYSNPQAYMEYAEGEQT